MTTDTAPAFKADSIGKPSDPVEFSVEQERIAAYAAATNDPIEQHASGELAPPVFSIVPAFQAMGMAALSVIPHELLGMILHGEQDFHFHAPMQPGMELTTVSTPIGMRQRSSGVTVVVRSDTRDAAGELVTEGYSTTFVRGAKGAEDNGDEAPGHAFHAIFARRTPTSRSPRPSTRTRPIATRRPRATRCRSTSTTSSRSRSACRGSSSTASAPWPSPRSRRSRSFAPDDPSRLKRLAVRFASIALPEQTITTRLWERGRV